MQGQTSVQKRPAHHFVDRIMAPDVFPDGLRRSGKIKNTGGVNPAGPGEISLCLAQPGRQGQQGVDLNTRLVRWRNSREILTNGGDAAFPAETATRRDGAEAFRGSQLHFHAGRQSHGDDVVAIDRFRRTGESGDRLRRAHQPFRHEETSGQLLVVAGRAHGRGHNLAPNVNFERLFDRQIVAVELE